MAGEVYLVNARRRRGRRKKARAARKPRRRRARRNPGYMLNRRRGRRRAIARRGRRRARRNPRIPLLGSVNFNAIGGGTIGYLGTRYGAGWVLSLPGVSGMAADPNTGALVRIGLKALVGIMGIPMLLRAVGMRNMAAPAAIGGGIAVATDLWETYVAKAIPFAMSDYEQQVLTDYEVQQLTGSPTAYGESAYGGGAF